MLRKLTYMNKEIDFYFDFISPYSYLAHKNIKILRNIKNINFNYKPILVGGLHNLNKITAPAFIMSKLKHMINDCVLIANKNDIDFLWNSKFPINSLNVMRGYFFINPNTRNLYIDLIFEAYWKNNQDVSNKKILTSILDKCKIDSKNFLEGTNSQQIKDKLKNVTKEAYDKEVFGVPTFVVNNKIFWGQDRIDFALDEYNK
tara:strand:+ start:666 stop:1271 length:606 start_codon:yes stop_codon:yes gene_type:complete